MRHNALLLFVSAIVCLPFASADAQDTDVGRGAHVYLERCALCHGSKGLGEGPLALLVRDYPDTNLKTTANPGQSISEIVEHGTSKKMHNSLSPPWQDELTSSDIAAVAAFVGFLRSDFDRAMIELASVKISPEHFDGRKIYRARCEGCHGITGKGDGRMSRIVKNPSPSDLTASTLTYGEVLAIIISGGKAEGRSDKMPPWGQEFISAELLSVANYLIKLRTLQLGD